MKRIFFCVTLILFSGLVSLTASAQNDAPTNANINTFVVDIDPKSKTKLVFTIHESELSVTARNLSELLRNLPNTAEINLVLGTQERQNDITRLLTKDLGAAVERGVSVKILPFDVNTAQAAMRPTEIPVAEIAEENLSTREKNERNTIITTRSTVSSLINDVRHAQWKGLITATLITGAGASTVGPSWVFAADMPVSYQVTSAFINVVLLYWLPRKSDSIHNFYKLNYEFVRTGFYKLRTLVSKDYSVPEPSRTGQVITTAFMGGVLASYSINSLLTGLAVGFDIFSYPEFQSVLLRNSLMIGAASTPWSLVAYNMRNKTRVSDTWATTIRTMSLLGVGLVIAHQPGLAESYLYGYSLNWSEYLLLATGTAGILANKYGISFLNKAEHSLWFQYLNRNIDYLVNLPENALRLLRGKTATHTYWSTKRVKRALSKSMCIKFLSTPAQ